MQIFTNTYSISAELNKQTSMRIFTDISSISAEFPSYSNIAKQIRWYRIFIYDDTQRLFLLKVIAFYEFSHIYFLKMTS